MLYVIIKFCLEFNRLETNPWLIHSILTCKEIGRTNTCPLLFLISKAGCSPNISKKFIYLTFDGLTTFKWHFSWCLFKCDALAYFLVQFSSSQQNGFCKKKYGIATFMRLLPMHIFLKPRLVNKYFNNRPKN